MCVYGCERMFERMLMSIAERLSPFFPQWTGCSQGKRKTHEASCPLPTSNVPACTRKCTRTHTHTHIDAHTQFLLLLQVSSLSSFSLSCFKRCWTGLGLRWFLCGTRHSLLWLWHHTLPHGALYTYTGDSETPEVYHTAQRRLKGHLRQSHIQAGRAFYVTSLIGGFYGKTLTILSSLLWGRMGEWEEGMCGIGCVVNATVGWGQFIWLRIVITLGFW